jgi:hypothetical protein
MMLTARSPKSEGEGEMPTVEINAGVPLSGLFTAVLVDSSGVPPTDVIRTSDAFRIDCTWFVTGGLASSLGGTWYVQAAFESIGPGDEFRTAEIPVPLTGLAGPPPAPGYAASISVPAGANFPAGGPLKVPAGQRNEPYQLTVLLAYTDVANNPGPLAASVNLETVTIYA